MRGPLIGIGLTVLILLGVGQCVQKADAQATIKFTREFHKLDDYTGIDIIRSSSGGCAMIYTRISTAGIPAVAVIGTGTTC